MPLFKTLVNQSIVGGGDVAAMLILCVTHQVIDITHNDNRGEKLQSMMSCRQGYSVETRGLAAA